MINPYTDMESFGRGFESRDFEVNELKEQNKELLEALIKLHRHFENSKSWGNFDSKYYAFMQITRPLIEKVTGKSWEEIKQIADQENK